MDLTAADKDALDRIRSNLAVYERGRQNPRKRADFYPEWCGVFEVNMEELLDIIGRASAGEVMKWTVVVTAADGTLSVAGLFRDEYAATLWANDHETEESGWTCSVQLLEAPSNFSVGVS